MIPYSEIEDFYKKAQDLIYQHGSDIKIHVVRNTYPYVITVQVMRTTHTFRIIRHNNLETLMDRLNEWLLAP